MYCQYWIQRLPLEGDLNREIPPLPCTCWLQLPEAHFLPDNPDSQLRCWLMWFLQALTSYWNTVRTLRKLDKYGASGEWWWLQYVIMTVVKVMIIYGSNIFCFLDSEPIQCSLFRPPSIGSFSVCFPTEAHSLSDPSFIGSFLSSSQTGHLQKRKSLSQKKLDSFSQFEREVKNCCFRRPMIYRACALFKKNSWTVHAQ